jgi:hypothetical protein
MAKEPIVWVIAYISPKQMFTVDRDLYKFKRYRSVEPYIPSIRILTKQVKGKRHFQTIPMLFNYGFFKVPKYFVPNSHYLEQMKKDIECIIGWVKDPGITKEKGMFTLEKLHNPLGVALASRAEISRIKLAEESQTFYTAEDIKTLYEGKIITLHTYPFEGLPAEILEINEKQRFVRVKLLLDTALKTIKVSFENVFFTVYREEYLDERMKEQYLDDLAYRHKGIENVIQSKHGDKSKSLEDSD